MTNLAKGVLYFIIAGVIIGYIFNIEPVVNDVNEVLHAIAPLFTTIMSFFLNFSTEHTTLFLLGIPVAIIFLLKYG